MIAKIDQDDAVVLEDDKDKDKKVAAAVKKFKEAKDEAKLAEVQEVVDVVTTTKLITKGIDEDKDADEHVEEVNTGDVAEGDISAAHGKISAVTEKQSIPSPTPIPAAILTAAPVRVVAAPSRRRKRVVIRDPEEESTTSIIIPAETKSKDKELHAELNKDIDWDEAIDYVKRKAKEDPAVKKYQAMKRKPQTEAQARKNMMMYLKNVASFKLDYFKGIEDLEALWSLVKERFSTVNPKNFSDDFMLTTLGAMFETPDAHAKI
nr:hypothetical protein [Tanacetum cinerariifolium]